jgi:hypothetical protein
MITEDRKYEIEIDYYADAHFQEDGEVDFLLIPSDLLDELFFSFEGTDSETMLKNDDYYDAYTCSVNHNGKHVFTEIEFVYTKDDWAKKDVYVYTLNKEESRILTERIYAEVENNWNETFEELLKDGED